MFLIGSPAGHGPFNVRLDQDTASDDVRFKEETFYSLCHATPPESAVAITYSNGASGKLGYWSLPDTDPPRTVVVALALFAHYRPRRGLVDTLDALADVPDTMLEMYQPAPFAASLRWKEGEVDGSATISSRWRCFSAPPLARGLLAVLVGLPSLWPLAWFAESPLLTSAFIRICSEVEASTR